MPIPVLCPGCNVRLNAPATSAGKTVKCPKCQTMMIIPAASEAASPPPPPPPKPAPSKRVVTDDDEEVTPIKMKSRSAEDEDNRSRTKQRDDEDEDDEPRSGRKKSSRRLRYDDEDDDRPRPRRTKKRRSRSYSNDGGGGGAGSLGTLGMTLGIIVGLGLIGLVLGFIWPIVMIVPMILGYIMAFGGGVWILVIAFQDDVLQGILCLLVPFYSLFYIITHWDECKTATIVYLGGIVMIIGSACAGAGMMAGRLEEEQKKKRSELHVPALVVPGPRSA